MHYMRKLGHFLKIFEMEQEKEERENGRNL